MECKEYIVKAETKDPEEWNITRMECKEVYTQIITICNYLVEYNQNGM